jgi:hypothetical protein
VIVSAYLWVGKAFPSLKAFLSKKSHEFSKPWGGSRSAILRPGGMLDLASQNAGGSVFELAAF